MFKFIHKKPHLTLTLCLLGASSLTTAVTGEKDTQAFVDSVNEWGAWELGLEPAAGGPAPMSDRALNVRLSNVKFRPNDNTTFSPGASPITITTPVAPAVLPVQVSPGVVPTPTGPGDRLR